MSTVLWDAAQAGQADEVDRLLRLEGPEGAPWSPAELMPLATVAAYNDHVPALRVLLTLISSTEDVHKLLSTAVHSGSTGATIALLQTRGDPDTCINPNTRMNTATMPCPCDGFPSSCMLSVAANRGYGGVLRALLNAKASAGLHARTCCTKAACEAAGRGWSKGLALLLTAKADPGVGGCTGRVPLIRALRASSSSCVQLLLDGKASVNHGSPWYGVPLELAVEMGRCDIVKRLLTAGAHAAGTATATDAVAGLKRSPLLAAARTGNCEALGLLISAKASARHACAGTTAASEAAAGGHCAFLACLVAAKVDVTVAGPDSASPVFRAALSGALGAVRFLVAAKADVDLACRSTGKTPLYAAAENGYVQVAETLLRANADVALDTLEGSTPLLAAADAGRGLFDSDSDSDMVNLLLVAKADACRSAHDGVSPLVCAAAAGAFAIVHRLLQAKADPNHATRLGRTSLYGAVVCGNVAVVRLLLNAKAQVHTGVGNTTPMITAAFRGLNEVLGALMEAKADPRRGTGTRAVHTRHATPVHAAVSADRHDTLALLLAAKADADGVEGAHEGCFAPHNSDSPLLIAVMHQRADIVVLLAAANADMNRPGMGGCTPLYAAAHAGTGPVVAVLLAAKADATLPARAGSTPLCVAALQCEVSVAELLVAAGASVNHSPHTGAYLAQRGTGQTFTLTPHASIRSPWTDGTTPLFLAAGRGHTPMVRFLLKAKACANAANMYGATPALAASCYGHGATLGLLAKAGADMAKATTVDMRVQRAFPGGRIETVTAKAGTTPAAMDQAFSQGTHLAQSAAVAQIVCEMHVEQGVQGAGITPFTGFRTGTSRHDAVEVKRARRER